MIRRVTIKHVDQLVVAADNADIYRGSKHGDIHGPAQGVGTRSDLQRIWAMMRSAGLVIFPDRSGQPRAFLIDATPEVVAWVEREGKADPPPWRRPAPPTP